MDERKRSLRKEIVRLALPIALQQFMTALVGACDAIMLGKLSQDAMSAVSLATQVTFVFNLFMFAFMAGENMFGRLGKRRAREGKVLSYSHPAFA